MRIYKEMERKMNNSKISNTFKKLIFIPKFLFSYLIYLFTIKKRKNITLINEKIDEARDNGYYLFKYIMDNNLEKDCYYVIKKNSCDFSKLKKYKNHIVYFNSIKHYYYYFISSKMISSQTYPYPISEALCKIFICRKKKLCWLQHGVTKDYSPLMDYSFANKLAFCSCACSKEREYFHLVCNYPDNVVYATGFCRFDGLKNIRNSTNKILLIMPTFRRWLTPKDYFNPTKKEIKLFKESSYYQFYSRILNSKSFLELMENNNIKVVFYLHYAFQPFSDLFSSKNSIVSIASNKNYDVQYLLNSSDFLITDYSSIAFDFSYLQKPLIYSQFDYNEFRTNHYGKGYFSYEKDGFGPITNSVEATIFEIKKIVKSEYLMDSKYLKRATNFFDIRDLSNCERVYKIIFKNLTT